MSDHPSRHTTRHPRSPTEARKLAEQATHEARRIGPGKQPTAAQAAAILDAVWDDAKRASPVRRTAACARFVYIPAQDLPAMLAKTNAEPRTPRRASCTCPRGTPIRRSGRRCGWRRCRRGERPARVRPRPRHLPQGLRAAEGRMTCAHVHLIWRPADSAAPELAAALGILRVSPEGAALLARQVAPAADLHDEDGRYCGAVDASGTLVWRDGP